MKYLDVQFAKPMENLACDEALVDWCERVDGGDVLRLWESPGYFVVLGYSNKVDSELNSATCAADGVQILRRCTGGGAVLQGPGCLNYTLVFSHDEGGWFGDLARSYQFVLERHRALFAEWTGLPVVIDGTSDLAVAGRKFSGNSQYRKRRHTLIHGTFLLCFDFGRITRYLAMPSKEPSYRRSRSHEDFLLNLNIGAAGVRQGLRRIWNASEKSEALPRAAVDRLVRERYSRPDWNLKF